MLHIERGKALAWDAVVKVLDEVSPKWTASGLPSGIDNATDTIRKLARSASREAGLRQALEESLKLQSHYAELLNMHDGGQRMTFTVETWLKRLSEAR